MTIDEVLLLLSDRDYLETYKECTKPLYENKEIQAKLIVCLQLTSKDPILAIKTAFGMGYIIGTEMEKSKNA